MARDGREWPGMARSGQRTGGNGGSGAFRGRGDDRRRPSGFDRRITPSQDGQGASSPQGEGLPLVPHQDADEVPGVIQIAPDRGEPPSRRSAFATRRPKLAPSRTFRRDRLLVHFRHHLTFPFRTPGHRHPRR
jgi:hypothetical protein